MKEADVDECDRVEELRSGEAITVTKRSAPTLTTEQLAKALRAIRGADSVELKLSIPDHDQRSVVSSLGMDPLDAQIRQVVFLDTPDLALNAHGVVVRVRRVQGKPADSVVKLRPVVPDEIPASMRKSPNFGVEVDAMPGGFVCSASMKRQLDPVKVKETLAGKRPFDKLFSGEQRDMYGANAPSGIGISSLEMLGPMNVLKLKFRPDDFGRRLVAELWFYPDGSRILELSTKCAPGEAFEAAAETKAYLAAHGCDLSAEQQTKTKTALSYFANALQGAGTSG
jgi:hypothetical protein